MARQQSLLLWQPRSLWLCVLFLPPFFSAAAADPYAAPPQNPYEMRRTMAREQAYEPSLEPEPIYAQPAPAPVRKPLKIVIPNINTQPPAPAQLAVEESAMPTDDRPNMMVRAVAAVVQPIVRAVNDITLPDFSAAEEMEEAHVPPPLPPLTPLTTAQAPATQPQVYRSSGIMIRREVTTLNSPVQIAQASQPLTRPLTAEELAALMPAAGGLEDSHGVSSANVPLIQLPTDTVASTTASAVVPVSPPPPVAAPEPAAEKPLIGPVSTPRIAPSTTMTPAPDAIGNYNKAALENIIQQLPEPAVNPAPNVLPRIEVPASRSDKKGNKKMVVESAPPSEPEGLLSQESEKIIRRFPTRLDEPKQTGLIHLDIDHAKDTSALAQEEAPAEEKEEEVQGMGIKIGVGKRTVSWDYDLGKAYEAIIAGNTPDAVAIYRNVLANDPSNKNALFGLATLFHRSGQLDLARPLYGKLLALDPKNRDALNNFLVLLADEAPQEALAQMETLEAGNPGFSPIPAQMAVIYQKLGDTNKASEKMFRAIALSPENLTYRYNLAIMMDKQQNYEEAAKLYRQIIEANQRGEMTPGNIQKIQERLTFISSNRR